MQLLKGANKSKQLEFARTCDRDASQTCITETEGIADSYTVAKAVRMGCALPNPFLQIAERSISNNEGKGNCAL